MKRSIHCIIQGKGGVGKTLVSSFICQHLWSRLVGFKVICLNTDPVNETFNQFKNLKVRTVNIIDNDQIIDSEFDKLIQEIIETDATFVIDNGASTFTTITEYLGDEDIIDLLNENGIELYFHIPITGGSSQLDTLTGLNGILEDFPENAHFIVWENRYFGEIMTDQGKPFEDMPVYKNNKDKINGIISFGERKPQFIKNIEKMYKLKLTYDEAIKSDLFLDAQKSRLKRVQNEIYCQLDTVLGTQPVEAN